MENKKVFYYEDELKDEVLESNINPIIIDKNYTYKFIDLVY